MKIVKRYDPVRDPAATNFIPVARAAALLHDRLFPGCAVKDVHTLDALAQALAAAIPMYLRDQNTGALRTLDKGALTRGRFARGAARLEFEDGGEPLRYLLVSRKELGPAIEAIAADPASPLLQTCRPPQPVGTGARAA